MTHTLHPWGLVMVFVWLVFLSLNLTQQIMTVCLLGDTYKLPVLLNCSGPFQKGLQ